MMTLINLLIISMMIVYVLDLSGFVDDGIQPFFKKHFKGQLKTKPFLCSMCMTHHIGLIYILIIGKFSIAMWGYVCLLSFLTPVWYNILIGLKEWLLKITNNN